MNDVVGVDVGGTFTDLICIDEEGNSLIRKVPSTPEDSSIGVMAGLGRMAAAQGKGLEHYGETFYPGLTNNSRGESPGPCQTGSAMLGWFVKGH